MEHCIIPNCTMSRADGSEACHLHCPQDIKSQDAFFVQLKDSIELQTGRSGSVVLDSVVFPEKSIPFNRIYQDLNIGPEKRLLDLKHCVLPNSPLFQDAEFTSITIRSCKGKNLRLENIKVNDQLRFADNEIAQIEIGGSKIMQCDFMSWLSGGEPRPSIEKLLLVSSDFYRLEIATVPIEFMNIRAISVAEGIE